MFFKFVSSSVFHFSGANCANDILGKQSFLNVTSFIVKEYYSNKSLHKVEKQKMYTKFKNGKALFTYYYSYVT